MKNFNLVTFAAMLVTTFTLVVGCSSAPAEKESASMSTATSTPAAEPKVASDPAPASSTITEPVTIKVSPAPAPAPATTQAVSDTEYTCKHGGSERIIRVFNDTASGLACEVTYEKSSGTQSLWTANNDKEYCAEKAADFASKQVGWGWDCVDQDGDVISAPVETYSAIEASMTEAAAEMEMEMEMEEAETAVSEVEMPETEVAEPETTIDEL